MTRAVVHDKNSEKKENIAALIIFGILILIAVGLFTNGFGLFNKKLDYAERYNVPVGNDPFRGATKAKIGIIAFSDYQCPFCRKAEITMRSIMEKYNDTAVFVFKDLPLTQLHPDSYNAALAAECAKEQDKYWEYHDYLFDHNDQLQAPKLKEYASVLGLNSSEFNECLDTQEYKHEVEIDILAAQRIGITGTPAFFINGIMVVGAQPEEEFIKVINSELERLKQ